MKFLRLLSIALVLALPVFAFSGCTETGKVDYNNPAVQQAASDAEQIALNELTKLLDRQVRGRSSGHQNLTIETPSIAEAMASAEAKIKRKHPEMSDEQVHAVALRAAKKKIDSSP